MLQPVDLSIQGDAAQAPRQTQPLLQKPANPPLKLCRPRETKKSVEEWHVDSRTSLSTFDYIEKLKFN